MRKNVYYLQCVCHDEILSEFIEDGLKISLIPLDVGNRNAAFLKGNRIWAKLIDAPSFNCDDKRECKALKDKTYSDWGYKEPFIVFNDDKWPLI